jgi:hypothetical protein
MGTTGRIEGQVRSAVTSATIALLAVGTAGAADLPQGVAAPRFTVHIQHDATADTLRRVLNGAHERLAEPRCQALFSEFRDQSGRPLRENLDALGHTGQSYLGLIIFYDGRKRRTCVERDAMAVTAPGSRVVWICPAQLYDWARRNPLLAEATIIHEALHTLGLGENPPSSQEITSRVVALCGR